MENEELLDALRQRMQTLAAKDLYKLRSRTVELNYADIKEHRGLRRFHSRGLRRVTGEIGAVVLAHNLLPVEHRVSDLRRGQSEREETPQVSWVA